MREKPLILIVDDERSFLEIMSEKLTASGFETAQAENGAQGIAQAEQLMPDLILMDIKMPDMTGTNAALAIKQNPKTKKLKIAFLTNLKEPWPAIAGEREKVAEELGMENFLEKTDDLNSIVAKVRAILAR